MTLRAALPLALLLLMPAAAHADDWSGQASLTGSRNTGNTQTTDVGLGLELDHVDGPWRQRFDATVDYGDAAGERNKERYTLGYQLERTVNDRLFVFGDADYFFDTFGSFREGAFFGAGLGYDVLVDEPLAWSVTAGLGYRLQESALFERSESVAGRVASDFDWQINDNVSFFNDSEALISEPNTYLWNESGLTAELFGNLAARVSFRVDHNTSVPAGQVKTDTVTRVGIVYTME